MTHPAHVRRRAVELYEAGLQTKEIARIVGVGQPNISRWANAAGLRRGRGGKRVSGPKSILQRVRVLEMHRNGASRAEIIRATGASQTTISRWVRWAGVQRKPDPLAREFVLAMRKAGRTYKDIIRAVGVSGSTVYRWTRDL